MKIGDDEERLTGEEAFALATADEEPEGNQPEGEQAAAATTEEPAEPEEGEVETEEEADEQGEGQDRDPQTGKFTAKGKTGIPSGRLRQESEARRQATERAEQAERRLADVERQLAALRNPPQRRQEQQQEEPADPDPYADPAGFRDAGVKRALTPIEQRLEEQRLGMSEMLARDKFGDKDVDDAFAAMEEAMRTNPQATRFDHQRIMAARHPYAELVKWRKAQVAAKEIGNDPAAYRQRIRDELLADPEFAKEVIAAETKRSGAEQQRSGGKTRSTIELPPSLNSRGGTGGNSDRVTPENPRDLLNSFFS
jgi:hypothetical protein